ncbi:MAG: nucleoside recognition domain-containing protein [Methylomonas sp.]|nr:nucleoside recognition domain-containing protein [Methylomonas sp.]
MAPLGIREDNWPATVALFAGILHKVVAISTLKTIYADADQTVLAQKPDLI